MHLLVIILLTVVSSSSFASEIDKTARGIDIGFESGLSCSGGDYNLAMNDAIDSAEISCAYSPIRIISTRTISDRCDHISGKVNDLKVFQYELILEIAYNCILK